MARQSGRLKPCSVPDARSRLAKAEQFLSVADLASSDASVRSAEASLLIDAGIAAADVICCVRLGERSADGNHGAAVDVLGSVDQRAAKDLRTLLGLKQQAQYSGDDPSGTRLTAASRAAHRLVETARSVIAEVR